MFMGVACALSLHIGPPAPPFLLHALAPSVSWQCIQVAIGTHDGHSGKLTRGKQGIPSQSETELRPVRQLRFQNRPCQITAKSRPNMANRAFSKLDMQFGRARF